MLKIRLNHRPKPGRNYSTLRGRSSEIADCPPTHTVPLDFSDAHRPVPDFLGQTAQGVTRNRWFDGGHYDVVETSPNGDRVLGIGSSRRRDAEAWANDLSNVARTSTKDKYAGRSYSIRTSDRALISPDLDVDGTLLQWLAVGVAAIALVAMIRASAYGDRAGGDAQSVLAGSSYLQP